MKLRKYLSMFTIVLVLTLINPIAAFASTTAYSDNEIEALNKFLSYGNNEEILDWDLTNPDSINEIIWEEIDGENHMVEINVSNMSITGKIDLSSCLYLDSVYFSNTDIQEVILPSNITSLSNTAFYNCHELEYVELNSTTLTIGSNTFRNCNNLKTLLNTDSITSIGANAFNGCVRPTFYGNNVSSVAKSYAAEKHFSFSTNRIVSAYCYIGIMTSSNIDFVDLTNFGTAYHTGYLTNQYGTFYADENGRIDYFTSIGTNNTAVISGTTAFDREIVYDVLYNNYSVSSENHAIGIIVCDYVDDEVINAKDYASLSRYVIGSNQYEEYCYDIDGDGEITDIDKAYFQEFFSATSHPALTLYTSWR